MVQWKDRLDGDVGEKAGNLESLEGFSVPNFFVVTSEELSSLFGGADSAGQVLEKKVDRDRKEELKNAYKEIGMSSEVRNADGKAKNLVGGQRDNQLVSVRVSNSGGPYEYRLNVGSSELIESVKAVTASFFEKNDEYPHILVQKMIEAEFSGSALKGNMNQPDLVEVVEGTGGSLEAGENFPYFYIMDSELELRIPDKHFKVSRNPMNGDSRRKKIDPESPFEDAEVVSFLEKMKSTGMNLKFCYKRGEFHVVDAWREDTAYEILKGESIQGVKVSEGRINGEVGREITYSEETLVPQSYGKALVSAMGGYTSRDAEKARNAGKPAVFGFLHQLEEGQRINMEEQQDDREPATEKFVDGSILASEVLPLNPGSGGDGVFVSEGFNNRYYLRRNGGRQDFSDEEFVDSAEKAFSFEGEKLILDARRLGDEAAGIMEYLEADKQIMIANSPSLDLLEKAIEQGFEVFGSDSGNLKQLREKVARAEKKFMVDRLRQIE
ncbi:MAG: hypothetical protein ABEJ56_04275 [Candidatus Nanohaloarchaea archaeon]